MRELTPETKNAIGEIAERLAARIKTSAVQWTAVITNNIVGEVRKLTDKANRKTLPSDTEKRRLQVARELAEGFDELLDSVEIHVTVGDRSFTVKGFGPHEDE